MMSYGAIWNFSCLKLKRLLVLVSLCPISAKYPHNQDLPDDLFGRAIANLLLKMSLDHIFFDPLLGWALATKRILVFT